MTFEIAQKTLQRLEWPQILERLAGLCATPRAVARCAAQDPAGLFEDSPTGVRERLAETAEARRVLADGDRPPLAGVTDLAGALARARRDGVLSPHELRELASTLGTFHAAARFLHRRRERVPLLAELAAALPDLGALTGDIDAALSPSGEIRDDASPALAAARSDSRRLGAELQGRLDRILRDPDTRSCLSDAYYTLRNDRYVLPVRSDSRAGLRGIVHGASSSGTTVFVEPEALVELNNRLKQSEIAVERETQRVLRDLSRRAGAEADAIEDGLEVLAIIDLAFARGRLADEMEATEPEVGQGGVLRLPQLRHPLLDPKSAVPNDLHLGDGFRVLVLSGPNAGGKTVAMKALALAALFVRAGLHVPAGPGARVDLFERILADIGDEQDIRENLSTFSAHMANLARIVDAASERSLVVLDEVGVGTDPGEGASLAQAALEILADAGARVVVTTHYNLLKEIAEVDERFENARVEFDPDTLEPTYRVRLGAPGASSATAVAARMGLRSDVIDRAQALLEREDRRLDRMLAELSASRAALEHEQREAERARAESEAARSEYRAKLERLQERRDKLFHALRDDLDRAFRDAHGQVAAVIRDLQRGGTAQQAARARERLQALEARAREAEERARVAPGPPAPAGPPVDWRFARAGDPVCVAGGGDGVLEALPDRRGRVAVRVGAARVVVPADRVSARKASGPERPRPPTVTRSLAADEPAGRLDLRGMRVDEALDRLGEALDRAVAGGRPRLVIVHGVGTGALCEAVRRHLAVSPYVARFTPGDPAEGGDGVTLAEL
jgi:DNA mismatch repair protein MutS2